LVLGPIPEFLYFGSGFIACRLPPLPIACASVPNYERAAEESRDLIRWLRPEYQNPAQDAGKSARAPHEEQTEIELPDAGRSARAPVSTARFGRANQKRLEQIEGILETLRGLGL